MDHHGSPCWYELSSTNLDAAQTFYTAILGWQIADSGMPDMDYRVARIDDTMVAGLTTTQSPEQPVAWTIYFAVTSTDETFAGATAAGATAIVPPADIPGTGRFALLRDPQGAVFGILQPLPGGQGGAFDQQRNGTANWDELITADPQAALAFYSALFGWTMSQTVNMGTMQYHIFAWSGTDIGGAFAIPDAPNMWNPYFGVASAHAAMASVTAAGGTVRRGPDEVPGGVFTVQINDPQGAMLALVGPA